MTPAILESPYSDNGRIKGPEFEANVAYAKRVLGQLLRVGYAPLASHLLYPGTLDDDVPDERALGMKAGAIWRHVRYTGVDPVTGVTYETRPVTIFACERGWTSGMRDALAEVRRHNLPYMLIDEPYTTIDDKAPP